MRTRKARARIGDTVTARTLGWTPPDYEVRDVRVRGVLVERHCARMALVEFPRGGVLCRGWVRAQTIRVVARAPRARARAISDAGAVAGVCWAPLTY